MRTRKIALIPLKKALRHPLVVVASPIVLTALILLMLALFGGRYRTLPFAYMLF